MKIWLRMRILLTAVRQTLVHRTSVFLSWSCAWNMVNLSSSCFDLIYRAKLMWEWIAIWTVGLVNFQINEWWTRNRVSYLLICSLFKEMVNSKKITWEWISSSQEWGALFLGLYMICVFTAGNLSLLLSRILAKFKPNMQFFQYMLSLL